MKKIIVLALAFLFTTFNPVFAEGKANVKIGKTHLIADSDKDHNVTVSKSGTTLNVAITAQKIVISMNPSTNTVVASMSFAVPEGDLEGGTTYDLGPVNEGQSNALVTAAYTKGSKGGGLASTTGSIVTGKLKVTNYNSDTGELKAILTATISPSTVSIIKNGSLVENETDKPQSINIKMAVTLE